MKTTGVSCLSNKLLQTKWEGSLTREPAFFLCCNQLGFTLIPIIRKVRVVAVMAA